MPTRLRITSDDGSSQVIDLTTFEHTPEKGGTVSVPVDFDAVHGRKFTFEITDIKPRMVRTSQKQKGAPSPVGHRRARHPRRRARAGPGPPADRVCRRPAHDRRQALRGARDGLFGRGDEGRDADDLAVPGGRHAEARGRAARDRGHGEPEQPERPRRLAPRAGVRGGREGREPRAGDRDGGIRSRVGTRGSRPQPRQHVGEAARRRRVEAVLARVRRELQRRLDGEGRRSRPRQAEARERVRERLARAARSQRQSHDHLVGVDAATRGAGGDPAVAGRVPLVPRHRRRRHRAGSAPPARDRRRAAEAPAHVAAPTTRSQARRGHRDRAREHRRGRAPRRARDRHRRRRTRAARDPAPALAPGAPVRSGGHRRRHRDLRHVGPGAERVPARVPVADVLRCGADPRVDRTAAARRRRARSRSCGAPRPTTRAAAMPNERDAHALRTR